MFNTLSDAKYYIKENEIKMIDLMMTDLNGRFRHVTLPCERLTAEVFEYGIGFDGSNYGFAPVESSDMVFIPDLKTAYLDPFAEVATLAMLGGVYVIDLPQNRRFDQDPRNVALQAEDYLSKSGIADNIRISPEFEFHVFDHVSYSLLPHASGFCVDSEKAEWNSSLKGFNMGYKMAKKGGYHMAPPLDDLHGFRSRASLLMEKSGIKVKYHHHEVGGPGQSEIEVEFGGLLEMADKTMMTKYILKNAAIAENKTVTFLPKPIYGEAGNGLHVHMHLFKNGLPLFYDPHGYAQFSETAMHFMGGILRHASALCAFTNPSTNSYKRLTPGYEAPVTVGFATSNRSAVIRIPAYAKSPAEKRFELRSPDGTCNPYYAYAAILMAGIDGVQKKIDPVEESYGPYDFNLFNLPEEEKAKIMSLPQSLEKALDELEKDHDFLTAAAVFPQNLIEIWLKNRKAEVDYYNQLPHPLEYALYFDL
ncbi:MAG: type I glutamate--ammonia ligase [Firmicutes bacterium]|nr:type I glutamate--ammonia ligase [Bacillota bacterium]